MLCPECSQPIVPGPLRTDRAAFQRPWLLRLLQRFGNLRCGMASDEGRSG